MRISDWSSDVCSSDLACAGMALLLLGAFRGDSSTRLVSSLVVLSFVVTGVLVVALVPSRAVTFSGLFVVDGFAAFMKLLILLGSSLAVVMSLGFIERERMARPEYPEIGRASCRERVCQ